MNFEDDIPLQTAVNAHSGTSFSPETRGAYERVSYANTLTKDYAALSKYAGTEEKKARLKEEFERYRAGYKAKTIAYLGARSRCLSTMITGSSGFNTRRAEKSNHVEQKRLEDLISFRVRALKAIGKVLRPELRPIMSGDSDAATRLKEKIDKAETNQTKMKLVNSAIRKHAKSGQEAQIVALMEIGLDANQAGRLLEPDFCGRIGFVDYQLTNNNANLRRMKERLAVISVNQEKQETEVNGANARVEDSPADNRFRLFFPGKPSEEIRSKLKSAGFRWSPSIGAWQAYRNNWSMQIGLEIAGVQKVA